MSSEQFRERGIEAAKARRTDEARKLLQQALRLNPRDEVAWLYLASVSTDKKERLLYLQKVLEINPKNEMGIKAVQALGITPEQLLNAKPASTPTRPPEPAKPPTPKPLQPIAPPPQHEEEIPDYLRDLDTNDEAEDDDSFIPDYLRDLDTEDEDDYSTLVLEDDPDDEDPFTEDLPSRPVPIDILQPAAPAPIVTRSTLPTPPPSDPSRPGIPIPDENYLREVLLYIEPIMEQHRSLPVDEIEWIRKEKGRAGERDIIGLRLQIAAAVAGAAIVIGLIGLFIVYNVPEVRRVVFVATRTPTLTPSNTPTATPGFTPTPSATLDTTRFPTYTPSPTIPFTLTPLGNINVTPRPTELDLPVQPERAIIDSAALIERGEYEAALPTLQVEQQAAERVYNPNPYYYRALALARSGEFEDALAVMIEAEEGLSRVASSDVTRYRPLVDLGFAEVFVEQALAALSRNNGAEAGQRLTEALTRLEEAVSVDPRLARAHQLIAQTYRLQGEYAAAIRQIDTGMELPELANDLALIIEKARTYLEEGRDLLRQGSAENARVQFERADYQAFYALYLNPYSETAHQLRIESALARDLPGLAVLYIETYLFYHPNNATALRYLGDARTAEGNLDLAFNAYNQALAGGEVSEGLINTLISRAELYEQERRYDLALADYNRALEAAPDDVSIRAGRMQAAYRAGDFDTVLQDSELLLGSGAITDSEVRLLRARVLVDQGGREGLTEALGLLNQVGDFELTLELAAEANDYRARVNFELENYEAGLTAINRAFELDGDTGTRHYLRGQIHQALDDFANAARDYEWVVTWNEVYGFDFGEDAFGRLAEVQAQAAEEVAETQEVEITPTP
jgi:tetratricopeptide (TPR) repeat protein